MKIEDATTVTTRELLLAQARAGALAAARAPQALIDSQHKMVRELTQACTPTAIREAAAELRGVALGMYYAGAIDQPMLTSAWQGAECERDAALSRLAAAARIARGVAA